MTPGIWICEVCGHKEEVPIFSVITKCPECKAEYEIVEYIHPHIAHSVAIMRLKGTDKKMAIEPITFATSLANFKDMKKYAEVLFQTEKRRSK